MKFIPRIPLKLSNSVLLYSHLSYVRRLLISSALLRAQLSVHVAKPHSATGSTEMSLSAEIISAARSEDSLFLGAHTSFFSATNSSHSLIFLYASALHQQPWHLKKKDCIWAEHFPLKTFLPLAGCEKKLTMWKICRGGKFPLTSAFFTIKFFERSLIRKKCRLTSSRTYNSSMRTWGKGIKKVNSKLTVSWGWEEK